MKSDMKQWCNNISIYLLGKDIFVWAIDSLIPGRCGGDFKSINFEFILKISSKSTRCEMNVT